MAPVELEYYHWICVRSVADAIESLQKGEKAITLIPSSKNNEKAAGPKDVSLLAKELETNASCQALALKRTLLNGNKANAFASMLKKNSSLRHFSVGYVNDKAVVILADGIKENNFLTSVHFPHNTITEIGATALVQAMKSNKSIVRLDIGSAICSEETLSTIELILLRNQGGKMTLNGKDLEQDPFKEKKLKAMKDKGFGLFRKTHSQNGSHDSIKNHYSISSSQASQLTRMSSDNPLYKGGKYSRKKNQAKDDGI
mmetsp:Transcript_252/g.309  ORF Transcript_252/g.309 Transcript_252/m.309 type:complete len:257 (+) Transcript_252:141-911(+)|eukprot:CAMPEP_0184041054 /NCGR_PEP_ID=MMETSP0955-20130417/60565_1 /TAXON_ID=627963 /ORGANISM="Aplanochytrium sp, Strain PBS07" /LENGTH=256 /DNA_ID=CAMNT_0026331137 /DNA_START=222 /DNA_END=992 /DNA_ORIENTATION=+